MKITMKNHWRKLAILGLLLLILVSMGAQNDSLQQTYQAHHGETKLDRSAAPIIPQNWGALGDGVHNDAGAIQTAIDSGATEIFLPNLTPNTNNPGKVPSTNYYLGTTSLTITKPIRLHMAVGTSLVYTGTDAPVIVDCSIGGPITGMVLDLHDVYSAGAYGLKITGASGDPWNHYVLQSRIKAHNFWNYTIAGIYCDTIVSQSIMDVLAFYPYHQSGASGDAWGFYFTKGAPAVVWEANQLNTTCVYSKRGAYLPAGWQYGYVTIGIDAVFNDLTYYQVEIGGLHNQIVLLSAAPQGDDYALVYPLWIHSGAKGNVIYASPWALKGMADDTPVGDNQYFGTQEQENYLLNPSFESFNSDPEASDWTRSNSTVARETTVFRHGRCGVKITSVAGGYACIYQPIPAELIGKTVTFSGWFKDPSTNAKSACISLAGVVNAIIPKDDSWHFMSVRGTVPNPANNVYIYANFTAGANAGEIVYADGCTLTVGNVPTFPGRDAGHKIYSKAAWDPGNVRDGAMTSTTVSLIGAVIGDPVSVGFSQAVPAGAILSISVTATDTVTVTLLNKTGAPLHLKPGILRVLVRKNE
jgi:hypothetical protein